MPESDISASETIRIAMWSGPRNISTAMMRSFENRPDTFVVDEPFYAAFLAETGLEHPMRAEVLASQPTDPQDVAQDLTTRASPGHAVFYQKHMTHHMRPGFPLDWMARTRHAFLIRDPAAVLASYARKHETVTLEAIGLRRQVELFERVADDFGRPPPVVDATDVLSDPPRVLARLCEALELAYDPAMLSWPAGPRASDGVWAPAWYDAVLRSTGFGPSGPHTDPAALPATLRRLAEKARPLYERLQAHALTAASPLQA